MFELFAKAASRSFFDKFKVLLNVVSKDDLEAKYKAAIKVERINRRDFVRK